jgi:glucosyl-3-phosphoglycerate phosphatase
VILIRHGQTEFNRLFSVTRQDPWWPQAEESVAAISRRSERFRRWIINEAWPEIALVTHWGFIRALTGLTVPNGAVLRVDPTRSDCAPEMVFVPDSDQR